MYVNNYDIYTGHKYHAAVRERSQKFLIKQIFVADNIEWINIPKNQKKAIGLIVYINRFIHGKPKHKIQQMVAAYLLDSIL